MKYYLSITAVFAVVLLTVFSLKAFSDEGIELPVIMYHSILKDSSRIGKYVASPSQLEGDLKYLKENGFESVTITDLINYTEGKGELPKKPVMITFDDGFYNNIIYAIPVLKKYNMRGVLSVVGKYSDAFSETDERNANYSHVTWEDAKKTNDEGILEIQNHSYDMHTISKERQGCSRKAWESQDKYYSVFSEDTNKIQNKLSEIGIKAECYTYPFGFYCKESEEIIKEMGFKASLSCVEGVNNITQNPECLYLLKRYNRPGDITTKEFFEKIKIST